MGITMLTVEHGHMRINEPWRQLLAFNGIDSGEALWRLSGDSVKKVVRERGTSRCILRRPEGGTVETYIKRYHRIPMREKIKNILGFKPYAFDAFSEWDSLCAFLDLGLNTMTPIAAARLSGGRSCDLTLGITDYTRASELVTRLAADDPRRKKLARRLGEIVGRMHAAGMAHQDLYLVHFFILENDDDTPFLIDLQRMIRQPRLAWRWRVKDLAQLLFSSQAEVSEDEIWTFWESYTTVTGIHPDDSRLSLAIRNKTVSILRHDRNRQRKNRIKS